MADKDRHSFRNGQKHSKQGGQKYNDDLMNRRHGRPYKKDSDPRNRSFFSETNTRQQNDKTLLTRPPKPGEIDYFAFHRAPQAEAPVEPYPRSIKYSQMRLSAIFLLILALLCAVMLFKTQVVDHDKLSKEVSEQYYSRTIQRPKRGDILDRNGQKIAVSHYVYRVGVSPKFVLSTRKKGPKEADIAQGLAQHCHLDLNYVAECLRQKDKTFIQFPGELSESEGKALEEYLNKERINGVRLDTEARRFYLNGKLASQVIGFAAHNADGLVGRSGLELQYNKELTGEVGYSYAAHDNYAIRGELPYTAQESKKAHNGLSLVTTLDMNVQRILQDQLEGAVKAYEATDEGVALALDPYTGEVLGMASYPYFESSNPMACPAGQDPAKWDPLHNPEQAKYLGDKVWRNRCISEDYEAGSTMKAVTAAIGMQENVTYEDKMYSDNPIGVLDYTISCWSGAGHGVETMREGFARSCNPVFVQIALAVGIDRFYEYMGDFGFLERTGIDLPNEGTGVFHPHPSLIDLATLAFGEQSTVTPLQLMQAYCALVNGGNLVRPHVGKALQTEDGQVVKTFEPEIRRQVISAETSARIRGLMKDMVQNAIHYANTAGYQLGGKTSTSTNEATGYNTVSFVCAGPIQQPRVLTMIVLRRPADRHIGGSEALIQTTQACTRILEYLKVDRQYSTDDIYRLNNKQVAMPNFIGVSLTEAQKSMTYQDITVRAGDPTMTAETPAAMQVPAEGTPLYPGTMVWLWPKAGELPKTQIPDFTGMNANECINAANGAKLIVHFVGNLEGTAVSQKIENQSEGSAKLNQTVTVGTVIEITLSP